MFLIELYLHRELGELCDTAPGDTGLIELAANQQGEVVWSCDPDYLFVALFFTYFTVIIGSALALMIYVVGFLTRLFRRWKA